MLYLQKSKKTGKKCIKTVTKNLTTRYVCPSSGKYAAASIGNLPVRPDVAEKLEESGEINEPTAKKLREGGKPNPSIHTQETEEETSSEPNPSIHTEEPEIAKSLVSVYDSLFKSYTVPASVRAAARRGLELRAKQSESNKAGLDSGEAKAQGIHSGVAGARALASGSVSADKIRRMVRFFSRHAKNVSLDAGKSPTEDKGYVAGLLWGGSAGRAWANKMVKQLDSEKEMKKAYPQARISAAPSAGEEYRIKQLLGRSPKWAKMTREDQEKFGPVLSKEKVARATKGPIDVGGALKKLGLPGWAADTVMAFAPIPGAGKAKAGAKLSIKGADLAADLLRNKKFTTAISGRLTGAQKVAFDKKVASAVGDKLTKVPKAKATPKPSQRIIETPGMKPGTTTKLKPKTSKLPKSKTTPLIVATTATLTAGGTSPSSKSEAQTKPQPASKKEIKTTTTTKRRRRRPDDDDDTTDMRHPKTPHVVSTPSRKKTAKSKMVKPGRTRTTKKDKSPAAVKPAKAKDVDDIYRKVQRKEKAGQVIASGMKKSVAYVRPYVDMVKRDKISLKEALDKVPWYMQKTLLRELKSK